MDSEESPRGQSIPVRIKTPVNDEPIRVTDRRFWAKPQESPAQDEAVFSLKPTYVEELEKRLAESQQRLDETLAAHREFKAGAGVETRKARERIQNEYDRRFIQAKGEMAGKFIHILENLDRALTAAEGTQNFSSLLEGIQLIRGQFQNALTDLGLKEISPKGEVFNPEFAEAVQTVEVNNEAEDSLILEVLSPGYFLSDVLIRPARVLVGQFRVPASQAEGQS